MSDGAERNSKTWQPATADEVQAIIAKGLARCTEQERALFAAIKTPTTPHPIERWGQIEQVFSVASVDGSVLFFEDVEEGWEWCKPDVDGVLRDYGHDQLELQHVLHRLSEQGLVHDT